MSFATHDSNASVSPFTSPGTTTGKSLSLSPCSYSLTLFLSRIESIPPLITPSPHSETSTITVIAPANHYSVFVVGDDEGKLSLWHMPRNKELNALSPNSVINAQALKRIARKFKPELLAILSLSELELLRVDNMDSNVNSNEINEKIVKLSFVCDDRYLIVSTTRRLFLIEMQFFSWSSKGGGTTGPSSTMPAASPHTDRLMLYESLRTRSTSVGSVTEIPVSKTNGQQTTIIGFKSFVLIDKAMPGRMGLFDFHIRDAMVTVPIANEDGDERSSATSTTEQSPVKGVHHERKIVQWRIIENDDNDAFASVTVGSGRQSMAAPPPQAIKKKCTMSRLEWSEEMFQALLDKMRSCQPQPLETVITEGSLSGSQSPMVGVKGEDGIITV